MTSLNERQEQQKRRVRLNGYSWAILLTLASLLLVVLLKAVGAPLFPMLMLPAVLLAGLRLGSGPAFLTAFLCGTGYLLISAEEHNQAISSLFSLHSLEIFSVFFLIAGFAGSSRRYTRESIEREQMQATLRKLSHDLASTNGMEEVGDIIVSILSDRLHLASILFLMDDHKPVPLASAGPELTEKWNGEKMWEKLDIVTMEHGDGEKTDHFLVYPLLSAGELIGLLAIERTQRQRHAEVDRHGMLKAVTLSISAAMQRELLAQQSHEADVLRKHEEFYAALLSSISHDFRTPLASIIGAAETLAMPQAFLSEGARQDMVSMIREEAERLNRFVSNLLDMTKLESGRLDLNAEVIEMNDIVGTVVMRTRRLMNHHTIEIDIPPSTPMFRGDFVLIEHVLTNLVENAIKYSPKGTVIRVGATAGEGSVILEVVDQGRGIPENELEKVFEKFYRVERGDSGSAGTGLGLSICRGIIVAHGGTIRAESPVTEGRGTRIRIELPAAVAPIEDDGDQITTFTLPEESL